MSLPGCLQTIRALNSSSPTHRLSTQGRAAEAPCIGTANHNHDRAPGMTATCVKTTETSTIHGGAPGSANMAALQTACHDLQSCTALAVFERHRGLTGRSTWDRVWAH